MGDWLFPIKHALDAFGATTVFFRDDDAGWADDKLFSLLDVFAECGTPIDLAVIPAALGSPLARTLLARREAMAGSLGLHQHGFQHVSHESAGRKCEFGPGRSLQQQLQDLRAGRQRLGQALGGALDPIFTPPWNRCSQATVDALWELGYAALSRDHTAVRLNAHGLAEIPVTLDWSRERTGGAVIGLGEQIAASIARHEPVGIMLHHAVMDDDDLRALRQFLLLLGKDNRVELRSMRALMNAKPATLPVARQFA